MRQNEYTEGEGLIENWAFPRQCFFPRMSLFLTWQSRDILVTTSICAVIVDSLMPRMASISICGSSFIGGKCYFLKEICYIGILSKIV